MKASFIPAWAVFLAVLCSTVDAQSEDVVTFKPDLISSPLDARETQPKVQSSQSAEGSISSPFFFLCHSPTSGEPSSVSTEGLTLTLAVAGNKTLDDGYKPHEVYEVLVNSNVAIDGFLLTGAHSLTKEFSSSNQFVLPTSILNQNSAGLVCSVVHRHISRKPKHEYSFLWLAPPTKSGCVRFLATGSLQDELIFKDVIMREVCEKRSDESSDLMVYKSPFVVKNDDGFVFRDDFDAPTLQKSIWSGTQGGHVVQDPSSSYGSRFHSDIESTSTIESKPMDFTEAQHVQYTIGKANCKKGREVKVYLGAIMSHQDTGTGNSGQVLQEIENTGYDPTEKSKKDQIKPDDSPSQKELVPLEMHMQADQPQVPGNHCSNWTQIKMHRVTLQDEVHLSAIPASYRLENICLKFVSSSNDEADTCFTLDNVAVVTEQAHVGSVVDEFDPVNPENWIFLSGGEIKEACSSEGRAAVFEGTDTNWLTSRQIDMSDESVKDQVILQHNFKSSSMDGWTVKGSYEGSCTYSATYLRMADDGEREICSPILDLTAGEVLVITGSADPCSEGKRIDLFINFENEGHQETTLIQMTARHSKESIEVPTKYQKSGTRICIKQPGEVKRDQSGWVISQLTITPWVPQRPHFFFQALVNARCGDGEAKLQLEASTTGGRTWLPLHKTCLGANCNRNAVPLSSLQSTASSNGWSLLTVSLPLFALTSHTMIRLKQMKSPDDNPNLSWAVDNVFIGKCPDGCSGHGLCQAKNTCKCEYGWSGDSCETPSRAQPFYLSEPFSGQIENSANILKASGSRSSYRCGIVGSGPAVVFDGADSRFLTTVDMNTSGASILQFHFQAGTLSDVGKCPGPTSDEHRIFVHFSCSGGAVWHLLGTLLANEHKSPSHISYRLPPSAKGPSCRFEIWQPRHDGGSRDMWAIDDLTITSEVFNSIELSFNEHQDTNDSLRFHLGKMGRFCGRENILLFTGFNDNGLVRFLETRSIGIGPSYMMQFDLKIGCDDYEAINSIDSTVLLEYSLTHGLTWNTVQKPCTPSTPGCEPHFSRGTTYHSSEFLNWKRVTLVLPKHTWSPTARLRLRQLETTESGLPWAVDNLYIGHACDGLCSGHGYCTSGGCKCDEKFHGHQCLPIHKLHRKIDSEFDNTEDFEMYGFHMTGGHRVEGSQGCGTLLTGHNVYFGAPGVREFETDDMNIVDVEKVMFYLVIGGGHGYHRSCQSDSTDVDSQQDELSFGSVVLEYSTDGGISWNLLKELVPESYRAPKQFQMELTPEILPKDKIHSDVIRFRLWQPKHKEEDQWALDSFKVLPKERKKTLQADFKEGSMVASPWLSSSASSQKAYCNSEDLAVVMSSTDPLRMAVTNVLSLDENDIISFEISVGCKDSARRGNPVRLEYSRDGGDSWQIVKKKCLPGSIDCERPAEPSIYWPGHHGPWTKVQISVDHLLSESDIHLRWVQENPSETPGEEFALQKIYIGPPCKYDCSGHGLCKASGICDCETGFTGKFCAESLTKNPGWLEDNFENTSVSLFQWERIQGGASAASCGKKHHGNVLMFDEDGPRFLTTKEIDTTNIKFLVFQLQIGADSKESHCRPGESPRDNVLLEFSTNGGVTWKLLQEFEPQQTIQSDRPHFIALPKRAKTTQTKFRWWQTPEYLMDVSTGEPAEWQIDNVFIMANETIDTGFLANGNETMKSLWFLVVGDETNVDANKDQNALHFNDQNGERYAETWDFISTEATVVQFDLEMNTDGPKSTSEVHLEYSLDNGRSWRLLKDVCVQPFRDCDPTDLASVFTPETLSKSRVTVPLPVAAKGRRTRLRFRESGQDNSPSIDTKSRWSLQNVFVGDSCPWMCSGHGYCTAQGCQCDKGYFGEFCVPDSVLPCEMVETFKSNSEASQFLQAIEGHEITDKCGVLVHKYAAVFMQRSPRYATTIDLDMTGGRFVQFTVMTGCSQSSQGHYQQLNQLEDSSAEDVVILVQYSTNGGIEWNVIKELTLESHSDPAFVSVLLDAFPHSRTNATRFRFWQPGTFEAMESVWGIDNIYIGGLPAQPNVLHDDFNSEEASSDAWIDWPAGKVGSLCETYEAVTALTFDATDVGEHAIYTKDLSVDEDSIVQFDIKVGCGSVTEQLHNVQLQYSRDYGQTWQPLRPGCSPKEGNCPWDIQTPATYYPNAALDWTRVTIPLSCLPVCGDIRLRWWQGYYQPKEKAAPWGLDNVYIGPACREHCHGHGYCTNGQCDCDRNYDDEGLCTSVMPNSEGVSENFEGGLDLDQFIRCSGSDISAQCSVISGDSLFFWHNGERMLETTDFDLTDGSIVEFYIRLGCTEVWQNPEEDVHEAIILFMFSTNGGISWRTISQMDGNAKQIPGLSKTSFHSFSVPAEAKTNATRLRWWEPAKDGIFQSQWAIDQISITNPLAAQLSFYDSGDGTSWKLTPGGVPGTMCGSSKGLVFSGTDGIRLAETPDIRTSLRTIIQFELTMGCANTHCYEIQLEYSLDHGRSWHLFKERCFPSDPDCPESWKASSFSSDLFTQKTLVTLPLPKTVRTKLARFRLIQKSPWRQEHTWQISEVHVGDSCIAGCSGRGICSDKKCSCQDGWTGPACNQRLEPLPEYIADDFTESPSSAKWNRVVGGKLSSICGPVSSGTALHFYGGCNRLAESTDIDLREALFVQFDLMTGCADQSANKSSSRDNNLLVQVSCNAGVTWRTIKEIPLAFDKAKYIWMEIPSPSRCLGGRVRWWQPKKEQSVNKLDWALDTVLIDGKKHPTDTLSMNDPNDLKPPSWIRRYNWKAGSYCQLNDTTAVMESTPSEPATLQTTDIHISTNHSLHFSLALGCDSQWDNNVEPVRLEYSRDFGRTWSLVRELCLPFETSSCNEFRDSSVFYAPQKWQYYVFPLDHIAPSKYTRFRWTQYATAHVAGSHVWSLKDVYIGRSCEQHCLGRGQCVESQVCVCDEQYYGPYCQYIKEANVPYIKDAFKESHFKDHWQHIQGGHIAPGCGGEIEEPPAAVFQGKHSRVLSSVSVDTRSSRFVLFTAHIGSDHGTNLCRRADKRVHNVFLQYSVNGGINWHLLRELDHNLYRKPQDDYITMPRGAMSPATVFRFWQPSLGTLSPSWTIDNVFIGGSEIASAQFMDNFDGEPTVAEWLFAPHSHMEENYCSRGDNGSLVWEADHPGHRAITTQELIVHDGHILQFKISVGCQKQVSECYQGPKVKLEYTKDGGVSGWELLKDICYPEVSHDPNCLPYVFHAHSEFGPDLHSAWTRVVIPIPEKAWSSTTQVRWSQNANTADGEFERILPWALDDVYVGIGCKKHCRGRGDCVNGKCVCDKGYGGETCESNALAQTSLPTSLIDGFEGDLSANWATVTGGAVGLGCSSLAPYGNGKHLYFNGCGTRQAITVDMDTRRAAKVTFVLRIGSHDNTPSCRVDLSSPSTTGNKGVVLQYSSDNGILWNTISVHDPLDFRKARRVAYSLPEEGRQMAVQLRWWQPDHAGMGTDQWALDNVEVILAQRKSTNEYSFQTKLW